VFVVFALDLVSNFMMEYLDTETFEYVRDHKRIANRYIRSGWFFIDFAATFPFDLLTLSNGVYTRLFRLFRLPKMIRMMDLSKFNKAIQPFLEK